MGDIVRRGTKDRPRFYIRYVDVDGKRKQRAVKGAKTKAEAQVVLNAAELRIAQGRVGMEEPTPEQVARKTITIKELGEKFTKEYRSPRLKNVDEYISDAKSAFKMRINPYIGGRTAASLDQAAIERDLRDKLLADEYSSASVVLTLALLSKVYTWARKQRVIDCDNPVSGVERPRVIPAIDFLSKEEIASLLRQAQEDAPFVFPMIATAVYTGMRKGELFGLRWTDVHLDAGRIDVLRSYRTLPKSGKARHIPINPELSKILRDWRDREDRPTTADGLVFPVPDGADGWRMGVDWETLGLDGLLKAAGCHVPKKAWHALRHTFASHFVMSGGNILTLQKLLGHSDIKMTLIYAHLAPDFMSAEIARMTFVPAAATLTKLEDERERRQDGHQLDTTGNAAPENQLAELA